MLKFEFLSNLTLKTLDSTEDTIATNDTLLNVPPSAALQQTPTNQTRKFSSRFDAAVTAIQHLHQRGKIILLNTFIFTIFCINN